MKSIKCLLTVSLLIPTLASAWQWSDLWYTANQQGMQLLKAGKAQTAAAVFKDKNWQGVAHYRAQAYAQAFERFKASSTSDGQYNAANAAAFMGKFPEAIAAYDQAIALNANNQDAIFNREIIKKLLQQQKNQPQQKQQQQSQQQQNQQPKNQQQKNAANKNSRQNPDPSTANHQDAARQNQVKPQQQTANNSQQQATQPPSSAVSRQQRQDENNKQLMRRLADDAAGLLQRKFLRDYAKRHNFNDNSMQGVNVNAVSN